MQTLLVQGIFSKEAIVTYNRYTNRYRCQIHKSNMKSYRNNYIPDNSVSRLIIILYHENNEYY